MENSILQNIRDESEMAGNVNLTFLKRDPTSLAGKSDLNSLEEENSHSLRLYNSSLKVPGVVRFNPSISQFQGYNRHHMLILKGCTKKAMKNL